MTGEQTLYPASRPYKQGFLDVGQGHSIFYAEYGNPDGRPIVHVHGGPGGRTSPNTHRYFDPAGFRIITFDQRGAGRSVPHARLADNSPDHLVRDMEALRGHLGIERWHVYGGSWGVALSLLYGQAHPERVSSFTLRGVFMMRAKEVDHFVNGMGAYFPEVQDRYERFLPENERGNLLEGYYKRLTHPDRGVREKAAIAWTDHEGGSCSITCDGRPLSPDAMPLRDRMGMARLESHFFRNHMFKPDDRILRNMQAISHIPTAIIQGRYDIICPPQSAFELARTFDNCALHFVDGGHVSVDPEIRQHLLQATNSIRDNGVPDPNLRNTVKGRVPA